MRTNTRKKNSQGRILKGIIGIGVGIAVLLILWTLATSIPPILLYITTKQPKEIIAPAVTTYSPMDFQQKLAEKHTPIEELRIASNEASIIGRTQDKITVIFSPFKDIDWQVASLQQIISKVTIGADEFKNRKPAYIDLRFDKPIVKF